MRVMLTRCKTGDAPTARHTLDEAIAEISPLAVIMVGVALTIPDRSAGAGDVVVSRSVRHCELQLASLGQAAVVELRMDDELPHPSSALWERLTTAETTSKSPPATVGTILTTGRLANRRAFRTAVGALMPEALGLDIESDELLTACSRSTVEWMMVKGLCRSDRQLVPARGAADFVRHALGFAEVELIDRDPAMPSTVSPKTERDRAEEEFRQQYPIMHAALSEISASSKDAFALFFDIDGFTNVNNWFSDEVGNAVLATIGEILAETPALQFKTRIQKDEFVAASNTISKSEFAALSKSLVTAINDHDWSTIAPNLYVRISAGVAEFRPGETMREWVIRAALGARLSKKNAGNRVSQAPQFLGPENSPYFADYGSG
jgi:diguanylate cyclase (GGDEF)-like protein